MYKHIPEEVRSKLYLKLSDKIRQDTACFNQLAYASAARLPADKHNAFSIFEKRATQIICPDIEKGYDTLARQYIVWLIRIVWHEYTNEDPATYPAHLWISNTTTGRFAVEQNWPLEPVPCLVPKAPSAIGTLLANKFDQITAELDRVTAATGWMAPPTPDQFNAELNAHFNITQPKEDTTMKLLTTAPVIETKTFINGRELSTYTDDQLLEVLLAVDNHIAQLRAIPVPLAKVDAKVAELLDTKYMLVSFLGGYGEVSAANPAPEEPQGNAPVEDKPKRTRRAKADADTSTKPTELPAPPAEVTIPANTSAADAASDDDLPTGPAA